jgi:ComEC/Rec2-related protein
VNGANGGWKIRIRRMVEQRLLLCAAVVAVLCVMAADVYWPAGCLVALVLGAMASCLAGWRKGVTMGVVGLAATLVLHGRKSATENARANLLESSEVRVAARILSDARGSERGWIAEARILEGPASGAKVMWRGRGGVPVAGSRVAAKGSFLPPEPPRHRGEFDRVAWMERMGFAAEFHTRDARTQEMRTPWLAEQAARFRHGFATSILHGLDGESQAAQVISAMVVGQRPSDADEMMTAFLHSGTLHVFSVSGLHVAMVGGIGWLCASLLGVSRRNAVMILLPLMFGYAWITGNGPPAVRSAWMAALFLAAFVFRRKPDLLNSLGTVLLAGMLWDGRMLFQTGVQLSYGVVAAIAVGMGPASRLFAWISKKELYLPDDERGKLRKMWDSSRAWLAGSLSVSLAAALGSTPLTMLHFGLVTPVSLLANLVLLPLVFGILSLGLLGAALFPVAPWASAWVNRANGVLADASVVAAESFASIPGGHIVTRRPDQPMLLVYDLPYGGMASVLTDTRGDALMFDCGGRGSFQRTVLPTLRAQGIEPGSMILSHPDGGHMGGGYAVWRSLPVREVVLPVDVGRSTALRSWKTIAAADGVLVRQAADVARIAGPDGAVWHRLNVPLPGSSPALADDRVAVWRLDWRGWRILFTSDAGFRTEHDLLQSKADIQADVIVSGKHRNDLSLGDDFLTGVSPRVILAKNPDYPAEERHAPQAVAAWKERGIAFVDKTHAGGVTLTVNGGGDLVISGFLTPERTVVLRRK